MTHLLSFDTVFENHSKNLVKWKKKNITSYVYSKQKIFEFSRQKSTMMCDINASKTMNDLLFLCILKLSLPNGF